MDKRLLIVDDEVSLLEMLESFFHDTTDFTVTTASSGEEAVEILKKKRYPIIITDLKMPGMNGMDLCKWIRETNPLSFIIAMTGYQDFHLSSFWVRTGCMVPGVKTDPDLDRSINRSDPEPV